MKISTTTYQIYSMLENGTEYTDVGQDYYEQQYKSRALKNLKIRARQLGVDLVETTGEM
jgi:hypothetical protein